MLVLKVSVVKKNFSVVLNRLLLTTTGISRTCVVVSSSLQRRFKGLKCSEITYTTLKHIKLAESAITEDASDIYHHEVKTIIFVRV